MQLNTNKITGVILKLHCTENSTVMRETSKGACALRVSSHLLYMSNAIVSSRESNPSREICHLRAVPLGHVADK